MNRGRAALAACGVFVASVFVGAPRAARAIPPPEPPRATGTGTSTPSLSGTTLPFGSPLFFVLDDRIDSGSTKPGTIVRMHLRAPLEVNGTIVAPAGSPATLSVVTTRHAQSGDIDGAIQIHLDPLALPGRSDALPVRAYHEYVTIEMTGGQRATRNTTDTVGDIFIPYHSLYHALRRGRQLVLPVGSVLRAQTAATIDASDRKAIVLTSPPPFVSNYDAPHADLTPPPYYTPAPIRPKPLPKGKATLPPSAPPSEAPSPNAAPSAAATK